MFTQLAIIVWLRAPNPGDISKGPREGYQYHYKHNDKRVGSYHNSSQAYIPNTPVDRRDKVAEVVIINTLTQKASTTELTTDYLLKKTSEN